MNRWRQRLAELHGDTGEQRSEPWPAVQNVQNPAPDSAFEHFEQIERRTENAAASLGTAALGEAEEERAALPGSNPETGHDGKIPREWAEGFARLDPDRPPCDVPPVRWRRFVDDVGLFLDSAYCTFAAARGWGPYDLLGADRDRPYARIDQAGLLWLLDGNRLVALSENRATIETRTGARQTCRRKPGSPGRVLAWELG